MLNSVRFFISAFIVIGLFSMSAKIVLSIPQEEPALCDLKKITFDVSSIDESGLRGNLDYEFCIPCKDPYLKEVRALAPEIECYHGSKGRIGCSEKEYLCLGNTLGKNSKNILCKLSTLDYIKRIDQCVWE